jgi:hypothetical protein
VNGERETVNGKNMALFDLVNGERETVNGKNMTLFPAHCSLFPVYSPK